VSILSLECIGGTIEILRKKYASTMERLLVIYVEIANRWLAVLLVSNELASLLGRAI